MLTVEHIRVRRRRGEVHVVPLGGVPEGDARALCDAAVEVGKAAVGQTRAALIENLRALPGSEADARLRRAIEKLLTDACVFDEDGPDEAPAVRLGLWRQAAAARAAGSFDRDVVLQAAADDAGLSTSDLERGLFADLKEAHIVRACPVPSGAFLLEQMALAEVQAVVLRATELRVALPDDATVLRQLLSAIKLQQLLFDVEFDDQGRACTLVVEGPMGLFTSTSRYGLKLALLVPQLFAAGAVHLEATVRLRKQGALERFVHDVVPGAARVVADAGADPARVLCEEVNALDAGFVARPEAELVRVDGHGAFVTDLVLERADGAVVLVELLGFWSRQAVWRRVEMVRAGLATPVLFAYSERLRVSEQALDDNSDGALLSFKGTLSPRKLVERASALAAKPAEPPKRRLSAGGRVLQARGRPRGSERP